MRIASKPVRTSSISERSATSMSPVASGADEPLGEARLGVCVDGQHTSARLREAARELVAAGGLSDPTLAVEERHDEPPGFLHSPPLSAGEPSGSAAPRLDR